ncbi:MAG: hypothetical protein QM747_12115 [Nocardioides sp.]
MELETSIPEIEGARDALRSKLDEVLAVVSPLDCLALSSALYLMKDADTYSEADDDRSPAHIEFLALSALPLISNPSNGVRAAADSDGAPDHGEAVDEAAAGPEGSVTSSGYRYWRAAALTKATNESIVLVRELFDQTTDLTWRRFIIKANQPGADVGFEEFRREAQLQSTNIRGAAYPEHLSMVLHGVLGAFDEDCRNLLGFTAAEAWSCAIAVSSLMSRRVHSRVASMFIDYEAAEKRVRQLRRKKRLPQHLARLTPTQQKDWLRHRMQCEHFADPLALLTITPAELSEETRALAEAEAEAGPDAEVEGDFAPFVEVSEDAASAWFDALTCEPTEYVARFHRQPCGGHPLTQRPVLKVPDGFLVPSPTSVAEALRPLMEDGLKVGSAGVWDRYERHRATWVENAATERLAAALPGAVSWSGIKWSSPEDDSDLDGLVGCDDFGARVQCKAGRVSPPARRGAPSMAEDIQGVINDASHQHARLAKALADHNAIAIGFTPEQDAALNRPVTVEVIVCLDDVTVWSTETHKLRRLVSVPNTPRLPWVLSLTDLFAVTDVLQGPELVHYLMRRLRLEGEERVSAHDELDWLGNYINDGLYFDDHFEGDRTPDNLRLMSFTGQFDTWYFSRAGMTSQSVPRPQQPMPTELRQLIDRLGRDRPRHWLTAGLILLNGDNEVRQNVVELMAHTQERAAAVGWCTGTQIYPDYTLAISVNLRHTGPELMAAMRAYWETNIREHGRPNAVSIGLGADGRIVVDVLETDPSLTIGHVLMTRRSPAADPTWTDSAPDGGTAEHPDGTA